MQLVLFQPYGSLGHCQNTQVYECGSSICERSCELAVVRTVKLVCASSERASRTAVGRMWTAVRTIPSGAEVQTPGTCESDNRNSVDGRAWQANEE
ncbi:hypothetical protein R1flu_016994 [Riccia fluitans]|uniref:Uncharacterized protein n=1 Tax=Riccia fluitans TaxID=41844 RepID=A0ABD1YNQ2_9MARC